VFIHLTVHKGVEIVQLVYPATLRHWRLALCAMKLEPRISLDFCSQMVYPTSGGLRIMPPLLERGHLEENVSFCGRVLTAGELNLVRQIIAIFLASVRLSWPIPSASYWNGVGPTEAENPECVEWLQKWQQQILPGLPELRVTKPRGAHRLLADDPRSDPQPPLRGRLADYRPLRLQLIEDLAGRRLFQQYIQRYHPLGYRVPYGAQLRYLVRAPSQDVLACLLFTSAAWKMAPRDTWIGWSDPARRANLPRVGE